MTRAQFLALFFGCIFLGLGLVAQFIPPNLLANATEQVTPTLTPSTAHDAINVQATQTAQAIQNEQATQTVLTSFPNIQGSYSGNYEFTSTTQSMPMKLNINQQNVQSFGGTCMLLHNYIILNGSVDHSDNIHFTLDATLENGTSTVVTFTGAAQVNG